MIGRVYRWLIPPEQVLRFLDVTGLRDPLERFVGWLNDRLERKPR